MAPGVSLNTRNGMVDLAGNQLAGIGTNQGIQMAELGRRMRTTRQGRPADFSSQGEPEPPAVIDCT